MVGNPFQMNVCEAINDFPVEWIKGPLKKAYRLKKLPINAFGGGQYSLFCKVQKGTTFNIFVTFMKLIKQFFIGTSTKLRNAMVKDLYQIYEAHIHVLSKQDLAYSKMVDSLPPRFLSGFTYEASPQPLRSQRIATIPLETDVNVCNYLAIVMLG